MSLTAPGIKGVVTDFKDAMPSATVAFQAVSTPARTLARFLQEMILHYTPSIKYADRT